MMEEKNEGKIGMGKGEKVDEGMGLEEVTGVLGKGEVDLGTEKKELEGGKKGSNGRVENREEDREDRGMDLDQAAAGPGKKEADIGPAEEVEDDFFAKALTERMVALMRVISEFDYLSIEEVGLIYANQTYAYNVLRTLKRKGLVEAFGTNVQPRKAYYLRPKGYRTLEKLGQLRVKRRFQPQHFKPFILNHRLACARAALTLEDHPYVRDFLPESMLWERRRSDHDKLCDGEFVYLPGGSEQPARVGLEVELSLKNRDKLYQSLRDLSDRTDLHHVWWLCGEPAIQRALVNMVREADWIEPQRHYFADFNAALKAGRLMELCDSKGVLYSLDPNHPTLPGRHVPPPPLPPTPPPVPTTAREAAAGAPATAIWITSRKISWRARLRSTWNDFYWDKVEPLKEGLLELPASGLFWLLLGAAGWFFFRQIDWMDPPAPRAMRHGPKPPAKQHCWASRNPMVPDDETEVYEVPCRD